MALEIGSRRLSKLRIRRANGRISISPTNTGFVGSSVGTGSDREGAFIEWRGSEKEIEISNDFFGFYPCYLIARDDEVLLSSSIPALVDEIQKPELDFEALGVFLRLGFFLGNDTAFKGIRALAPGTVIRFDVNGTSVRSREYQAGGKLNSTFESTVTEYGKLFDEILQDYLSVGDARIALPLSGGRDSRHILFGLLKSGLRPEECVTVGADGSQADEDVRIARQVCDAVGIPHSILDRPTSAINSELKKNKLTNYCAMEHAWILPVREYFREKSVNFSFDGISGDVLCTGVFNSWQRTELYKSAKLHELADQILEREEYFKKFLSAEAYQLMPREKAISKVVEELGKYVDAENPIGQFFFWNKTRRQVSVSTWGLLGSENCHCIAPFLHRSLIALSSRLPIEYILDRPFHDAVIAERYPQFKNIPYEDKTVRKKGNSFLINVRQNAELLLYFRRSLKLGSLCRSEFVLPRILKCLTSSSYYYESSGILKKLIYLSQVGELISRRK